MMNFSSKKISGTSLLLLVLLSVLCVLMYVFKSDFEKVNQASYADLYDYNSNPLFERYEIEAPNIIRILLKQQMGSNYNWQVKISNGILQEHTGNMPQIKAISGLHRYDIYDSNGKLFTSLQAEYYPQEEKQGMPGFGKVFIYSGSLLLNEKINNLDRWKNSGPGLTESEKKQVQQLLKNEIKLSQGDSTQTRVKKIAAFICSETLASAGSPTDSVNSLQVMAQFTAAQNGHPVWCGHYANFLRAFLDEAGIINRYIEVKQNYGVDGQVHIFNEYFIPEQNSWALADISFGNWGYMDATGKLMNAVDIKNCSASDSSVHALHYVDNRFEQVPFSSMNEDFFINYGRNKELYFYYTTDMTAAYSFVQKIKRFVTGDAFTVVYSDTKIYSAAMHYLKTAILFLEAIAVMFVALQFISRRSLLHREQV